MPDPQKFDITEFKAKVQAARAAAEDARDYVQQFPPDDAGDLGQIEGINALEIQLEVGPAIYAGMERVASRIIAMQTVTSPDPTMGA